MAAFLRPEKIPATRPDVAFHLGLMLFGWGFWLWSVPALAFLPPSTVAHWRHQTQHQKRDNHG